MNEKPPSVEELAGPLIEDFPCAGYLGIRLGDCRLRLLSNSLPLLEDMKAYFDPFLDDGIGEPDVTVHALEAPEPGLRLSFRDWEREGGKVGRKDSFADVPGGRVVRKVRTGMQFLMGRSLHVAVGPCGANPNQVINYLISRYITWLLHRDWILCHAAAVSYAGGGIAMAGFSGAGKSTFALEMLGKGGLSFASNDRLLVRSTGGGPRFEGVPKQPRINPGTILNHPQLESLIAPERRDELLRLPREDLWALEDKYDADVERIFGPGSFDLSGRLDGFVILAWDHRTDAPARYEEVRLTDRPDVLEAVMKSPGPFHQAADGTLAPGPAVLEPAAYHRHLDDIPFLVFEGGVDFAFAERICRERFFPDAP